MAVPNISISSKLLLLKLYLLTAIHGNVLLNVIIIFTARNPPPFCVGTGVPLLNLCVRLYNIRVQNNNVRVCINLELQFASRPLIVVSFDCIRVGVDGVGIEKPSTTRVVSPDPVRGKHVKTIVGLTPEILSSSAHISLRVPTGMSDHKKPPILASVELPIIQKPYLHLT
jgi:hypothetical protein